VSAFSFHASICGDIFISWSRRFSPHGDTVNLSRCLYRPAILTLCVNPQKEEEEEGTAIAQFSVATTERWKDKDGELKEHTEWFAVKTFRRQAEIVGEHLHKGSRVYLEGRKRTESWEDRQTGAKHYRDLVYVDRIEFLDSKGSGNGHREPAESAYDETTVTDQETPF
jgi:single-strand DNA-binding protein